MLDGLYFDIALQSHEQICEFSSPSLYPLSPKNCHGARTGLAKRKKEERQRLEKGEGMGRKPSPFPYLMRIGMRWDASWLMGHTLPNKMSLS